MTKAFSNFLAQQYPKANPKQESYALDATVHARRSTYHVRYQDR